MNTTVTDVPVPTVRRDAIQPGQGFLQNLEHFSAGFVNIAVDDGSHVQLPQGYRGTLPTDSQVYPANCEIAVSHP